MKNIKKRESMRDKKNETLTWREHEEQKKRESMKDKKNETHRCI